MIKLTKTHKHKIHSEQEWRSIVIGYARKSYELNGRVYASDVRRLVGRKVDQLFGSMGDLISDAGLPDDALYGSHDCEYCGTRFIKNDVTARFCCKAHQAKSRDRIKAGLNGRHDDKIKCKHCGTEFEAGDYIKKYCSSKCRNKEMSRLGNRRRRASISSVPSTSFFDEELAIRDGVNCSHCGIETRTDCSLVADDRRNNDHIIPLSRGGHDAIYNYQILCRKCNIKKGNKISAKDYSKAAKLWPTAIDFEKMNSEEDPHRTNKCGVKGVFFDDRNGNWFAQINSKGKRLRVRGDSKESAIEIRKVMKSCLGKGMDLDEIKQETFGCRDTKSQQQ